MPEIVIVVPCYNEARRFVAAGFAPLFADPRLHVLVVDDGSTDETLRVLEDFASTWPGRVDVLARGFNAGKAEAVRAGLSWGRERGARIVGYFDADLATPASELLRMLGQMEGGSAEVVMASRVRLLGHDVERHTARHYLGRIFATTASIVLGLGVYDTQCGAKLLRTGPALEFALARPFRSRWAFDVELLQRLLLAPIEPVSAERILEVPLRTWHDVSGSKMTALAMVRAGFDLAGVFARRKALVRGKR